VPAVLRLGLSERADVAVLGLTGALRRLRGVDAHGDDAELFAGDEVDVPEPRDEAVQHQAAQHRAVRVVEREDDGALAVEVVPEAHGAAELILERERAGQVRAEALAHVDLFEPGWRRVLPLCLRARCDRAGGSHRRHEQDCSERQTTSENAEISHR
jgi:hypothetical protein